MQNHEKHSHHHNNDVMIIMKIMLETTTLHHGIIGIILSTLIISSHGFAFGFSKRPHTNGDVFLYKPNQLLN